MYNLTMSKKKAKLVYKNNYFEIVEKGNYVLCAISGKKIKLENLNYWDVDLQEAYFSQLRLKLKSKIKKNKYYFHLLCVQIH